MIDNSFPSVFCLPTARRWVPVCMVPLPNIFGARSSSNVCPMIANMAHPSCFNHCRKRLTDFRQHCQVWGAGSETWRRVLERNLNGKKKPSWAVLELWCLAQGVSHRIELGETALVSTTQPSLTRPICAALSCHVILAPIDHTIWRYCICLIYWNNFIQAQDSKCVTDEFQSTLVSCRWCNCVSGPLNLIFILNNFHILPRGKMGLHPPTLIIAACTLPCSCFVDESFFPIIFDYMVGGL